MCLNIFLTTFGFLSRKIPMVRGLFAGTALRKTNTQHRKLCLLRQDATCWGIHPHIKRRSFGFRSYALQCSEGSTKISRSRSVSLRVFQSPAVSTSFESEPSRKDVWEGIVLTAFLCLKTSSTLDMAVNEAVEPSAQACSIGAFSSTSSMLRQETASAQLQLEVLVVVG
jgi:hypothetical protein